MDHARMARDMEAALKADPAADQTAIARQWVEGHGEAQGTCMAR
jgi:hypothetical protein